MADYSYRGTKKTRKIRYHLSLVFFAGLLIFAFMFYKYMRTTSLEDVLSKDRNIVVPASAGKLDGDTQNSGNVTAGGANLVNGLEVENPVTESEAEDKNYFDSCTFIGDSLTYGMLSYGIVPQEKVYATMSMTAANIETEQVDTAAGKMTVLEALEQSKGENIYIMLSAAASSYMSVGDMYSNLTSFIGRVKSACQEGKIFIVSAPPVSSSRESSKESPIKNSDIDSYNAKLLEYANSNNIYYLDINTYLKDNNGYLPFDYSENDGLHLKQSAYEKLSDYILTHTVK